MADGVITRHWGQIPTALVAGIIGAVGTFYALQGRVIALEDRMKSTESQYVQFSQSASRVERSLEALQADMGWVKAALVRLEREK